MANVVRQLDLVSAGGQVIGGSPDTFTNGLPQARQMDMVQCKKHGLVYVMTCSPTVFANGLGVARQLDLLSCGDYLITGSPDTFSS